MIRNKVLNIKIIFKKYVKNISNSQIYFYSTNQQKTQKTRLVERVVFVFIVSRVLKMTLFREQQNVVFPVFLLFTEQN